MAVVIEKSKFISKIFFGVFWIVAITPFFGQEFMPSVYEKISSPLFALIDFVLILLGAWVIRDKKDWFFLLLFVGFSFISTCIINDYSILFFVNGLRLYLCYIIIVPIFRYFLTDDHRSKGFIEKMDRALYIFLWLQLPTAAVQCFLYGAYDQVGGSMGWMMSGEMSTLVYLISFYLMHKNWDSSKSYIDNIRANWILIFLLIPSFLNETKISFIYLLMYFFFLIPMDKRFIKRLLIFIPCIIVIFTIAGYFYLSMTNADSNVLTAEYFKMYFSGDDDALNYMEIAAEGGIDMVENDQGDLFRGVKFAAIPLLQLREPHAALVGFGVGQFKGGTSVKKSEFAKEFEWLLKGAVMGFYMVIIELGYIGFVFTIIFWIITFRGNRKNINRQILLYQIFIVILLGIYNSAFIHPIFYLIFFYILFVNKWVGFKR